jgi:flagellar motor switch protein FliG
MSMAESYDTAYRELRGSQKVAALLLVMGKPLASRLLGHFDPAELKLITRSAAQLGSVPIDVLEDLVEEFAGEFSNGIELRGTADQAENLLTGVLPPDQVADIMSDVLGSSNRSIWEKIAVVPAPMLGDYLMKQHPQVLALALSKLPSVIAAAIMEVLPREIRNETTRRLLGLAPVADAALRVIESRIHQDLVLNPPAPVGAATSKIADIINKMAPEHAEDMLRSLEAERPEDAEALRSKLFSFDDLVTLPQKTRQALFEKVPSDRIVIALSSADAAFRTNVLSSLTARARRLVENELNSAGDVPARDVTAARRMITDTLLAMAERGEVELRVDES